MLRLWRQVEINAEGCSVVSGVVNDATLDPVPRSLGQFFSFLPATLSK
jgi:hypothetical protein